MIDLKTQTKFEKLKLLLREGIVQGKFQPGERFYSDNTLAAEYGVSHVTASKVISALLHEGLVRRVQGLGTFVESGVVQQRSPLLGLLTFKQEDAAFGWGAFYHALALVLQEREMFPAMLALPQKGGSVKAIERFVAQKPAGLLIDCEFYMDIRGIPETLGGVAACVIGECPIGGERLPGVLLDKREMYRQMMETLWDRGHKQILFYGFIPELWPQQKEWYEAATTDFVRAHPQATVSYASETDACTQYEDRLQRLFARRNAPTGMLAMTDYVAQQAMVRLSALGATIGWKDIIGVGGTVWSRQPGREFTSLQIDYSALIERALIRLEEDTVNAKPVQERFRGWTL